MVMETPPSPQCVGREFVRQYYTLLNEAPAHLHRFYNNSSSFIHGGLDPPNRETTLVVGQKQIHQKIQQLNFRDCHAKITQVDSQATLGNGVVVQVTGELSNGGQPMRRFTQTFVLAFQAPKKYYVHNDIFRYQDMLTEDEYEEMSRSEIEVEDPLIQQQNTLHSKTTLTLPLVEDEREDWSSQPMVNGTSETHDEPVASPQQHQPMHAQVVPVVPVSPQQLMNTSPSTPVTGVAPQQPQPVTVQQHSVQSHVPQQEQDVSVTSTTHHHPSMIDKEDDPYRNQAEPETQQIAASPQNSTGDSGVGEVVKTYANLVKGSSASGTSSSSTAGGAYYSPAPPPPAPTSPTGGMGRLDRPKPQRTYRTEEQPINMNNDSASFEVDRGRKPHYSDSQQLFMGNLPHYATEMELKEIFGKFGNIVDLRVLSKPGSKGPGGRVPPNYGFIIFEQASSVQAVLGAKPIIYPDDSGTKLNVEEKKTKVGGGGVGGGGGGGSSGGGRGGRGGGRGSLLGPPGRGGPRPGPPPSSSLTSRQNFHRR